MKTTLWTRNLRGCRLITIDENSNISMDINEFNKRLLSITKDWQPYLINPMILDGLHFELTIENDGIEKKYVCQNKYPKNFDEFNELLKEANIW